MRQTQQSSVPSTSSRLFVPLRLSRRGDGRRVACQPVGPGVRGDSGGNSEGPASARHAPVAPEARPRAWDERAAGDRCAPAAGGGRPRREPCAGGNPRARAQRRRHSRPLRTSRGARDPGGAPVRPQGDAGGAAGAQGARRAGGHAVQPVAGLRDPDFRFRVHSQHVRFHMFIASTRAAGCSAR